jgi:hypothetical protein
MLVSPYSAIEYYLLIKAGINKTHERTTELFYGVTQGNIEWVLSKCRICLANEENREPKIMTPIISRRVLDRVYMDFTSQPDGEYKWVLRLKDRFSRMIWLFPMKDKGSVEVSIALRTFFAWCDLAHKHLV